MGGVLMVHASFRALSRKSLRCETFLEELLAMAGGWTVLMPTMTWRGVTPDNPMFDELATPSETGALSEVFRVKYATHRSLHPTHSVAGVGPEAGRLLASHQEDITPCGLRSPYGRMRLFDARVVFLGVGVECCTAVHHVEEEIDPGRYLRPAIEVYRCRDRLGGEHMVPTRRHTSEERDYPALLRGVPRRRGEILGVPWMTMRLADIYEAAYRGLRRAAA